MAAPIGEWPAVTVARAVIFIVSKNIRTSRVSTQIPASSRFPSTVNATTGEYIPNSQEGGFCNPHGNSYDRNIVFDTTPWGGILKFFGSPNTPASSGFDAEMIQLLPLLINVSYTNEAFRGINKSFKGPKDTVLSLLGNNRQKSNPGQPG